MSEANKESHDEEIELPTILQAPKRRKKRILVQLFFSIVILIIGSIIIIYGITPLFTSNDAKEIFDDYDPNTGKFKSHDTADKFYISGEITEKVEATEYSQNSYKNFPGTNCRYRYMVENDLEIYSNDDFGNDGENVIIECEISKLDIPFSQRQYLNGIRFHDPILYVGIGVVIIIISLFIFIAGYRRLRAISSDHTESAYKVATMYKAIEDVDDEEFMYRTLRFKDKEHIKSIINEETSHINDTRKHNINAQYKKDIVQNKLQKKTND